MSLRQTAQHPHRRTYAFVLEPRQLAGEEDGAVAIAIGKAIMESGTDGGSSIGITSIIRQEDRC